MPGLAVGQYISRFNLVDIVNIDMEICLWCYASEEMTSSFTDVGDVFIMSYGEPYACAF